MFRSFRIEMVAAVLCLVASASLAAAQGSITANGTSTLRQRPDTLRLQVELSAEGKDLKEALSKLKQLQATIKPQIIALGAADASVAFGDAHVQQQRADQRRQMEQMMRARMGGRKPTTQPQTPPVVVAFQLKAEWPIKAANAEESLLFAHDLKQKVSAITSSQRKALTPEEEERMEEEGASVPDYDDGSPKPGEAVFLYVKKIAPADRAKAMAEAFARAREEAQQLARAAGVQLGALVHLSVAANPDYEQYQADPYAQRMMYAMMQGRQGQAKADEAAGMDAGTVTTLITVTASFQPQ